MNITVTCVSCGQKLSAPENLAGRRVPCPKCKAPVDVPAAGAVAREPAMAVPQVVPELGHADPLAAAARLNPMPPAMPGRSLNPELVDVGLAEPAVPSIPVRPAARPAKGVTAPMIAVAVLLMLAGVAIGGFLMLTGKSGAGSDLNYLPDDPDFIVSADVSGMISSGAGQKIKGRANEMLAALNKGMPKDSKFKPEDVGRITFGVKIQDKKGAGIIHFNRPVNEQDVPPMARGAKKSVGQYQIVVDGDAAFCQIAPQTIATGDEDTLRKVLERHGPARISEELTSAMSEVDFSKSLAMAASLKNLANMAGPGGMNPMSMQGMKGIRCGAIQADVGNDIRLSAAVVCKDATTADQMKKMADAGLAMAKMSAGNPQMPPQAAKAMKILDTLDISNSGAVIRASLTIDVDTILSLIPARLGKPMTERAAAEAASGDTPAGVPTQGNPVAPEGPSLKQDPIDALGLKRRPAAPETPKAFNPDAARQATYRTQATNNLKQIALAIQNYADKQNRLPPAAIADINGRLLLSWRVAILPYLGQEPLYKQFHLDEPWDGPHNKRLLNIMPFVFKSPGGKNIARGKTCILAPVGGNLAFDRTRGRSFADFTDGLSNTILVVEAAPERAVEWTRPRDFDLDENDSAIGLFGTREGGVLAGFADGSVKFIPQTTSKDVLHALFTINGGESVPTDF
jgi:Protein of unknown function (DUF1559)